MRTIHAPRLLLLLGTSLVVRFGQTLRSEDRERGDVPGWVMITLMSATLVAFILVMAQGALESMFNAAMEKVNP
ncbi:hypothetical protein MUG94_12490 [Arthrobacter gengyunqii]|uniref:Uncharacterized protein n=1 Tax=Arthrobacter gengyunqii TaxID=2886940 RepID=A0A9X1LYE8_9MICC|nr:hypothetical protein [Arthrobacter gengyunqii]MCC3267153.1 hypothetical protein [Arthrobacter gengyunqii]MCC3267933.1 hypothetical protein [Arthrobacter gengyunqii]UOY95358.1 hypothetical protein MUG94_12490 [Arthrobacter gengyunqii]